MHSSSTTIKQHFISQIEQRLNSANPNANKKNQKIYEFAVEDRENYLIKLKSKKGESIEHNLKLNDLFSFDIIKKENKRYNLEDLFNAYETRINETTKNIIDKLNDVSQLNFIKTEMRTLFAAKFLNLIRNPYTIEKMINTFKLLLKISWQAENQKAEYTKLIDGNRPHREHTCQQLKISENNYNEWLIILYNLLSNHHKPGQNLLDQLICRLFDNIDYVKYIDIFTYTQETCLLSDRGFSISHPDSPGLLSLDFNICSTTFARYTFIKFENHNKTPRAPQLHIKTDELLHLEHYNKNIIYQCFKTVFNSKPECYGLPPTD